MVIRHLRSFLARLNPAVSVAPTEELVTINHALIVARCAATAALIAFCLILHATILPTLALRWIVIPCAVAIALSVPYRR
ncbi:MAG: hypothetical protein ABI080_09460, partial [Candidatus Binatia bacterium]